MFNSHIILKYNIHNSRKSILWRRNIFSPTFGEGCFLATPYNQNQSLAELWLKVLLEVIISMRKRPMSVLIRNNRSFLILVSHSPKLSSCFKMSLFSWILPEEGKHHILLDRAHRPLKLQKSFQTNSISLLCCVKMCSFPYFV